MEKGIRWRNDREDVDDYTNERENASIDDTRKEYNQGMTS